MNSCTSTMPSRKAGCRSASRMRASVSRRKARTRHPQQADRGGRLREVRLQPLCRHQALRPGRRRSHHPGAGTDHQARRPAGRQRDRAGHGPSRPPERAGQCDGQALSPAVPRIPGRQRQARRCRGFGRREIPSGRLVGPGVRRPKGASVPDPQSLASGNRQSGGAGQGPRQAMAAARHRRPHQRAARSDPWRCRLCRPGRGGRMLRHVGHQGLPHRRHHAFRHQQPDRLHHRADLLALLALLHRYRPDGAGADFPRERRRSRSGGACHPHRDGVPPEIQEGRGARHDLLSQIRA